MKPHAGSDGADADRPVERSGGRLGVDSALQGDEVVLVGQLATADSRRRPQLLRVPATLAGNYVAGDPEQPRHGLAAAPPIGRSRLDCRDEDVRRQVGRELRIVDAPRDEPLNRLDVLTVEALEGIRIASAL